MALQNSHVKPTQHIRSIGLLCLPYDRVQLTGHSWFEILDDHVYRLLTCSRVSGFVVQLNEYSLTIYMGKFPFSIDGLIFNLGQIYEQDF